MPVVAVAATTQPLSAPHTHQEVAAAAVLPVSAARHADLSLAAWLAAVLALSVMAAHAFVIRTRFGSWQGPRASVRRTA